jgi:hypothetical protein
MSTKLMYEEGQQKEHQQPGVGHADHEAAAGHGQ